MDYGVIRIKFMQFSHYKCHQRSNSRRYNKQIVRKAQNNSRNLFKSKKQN